MDNIEQGKSLCVVGDSANITSSSTFEFSLSDIVNAGVDAAFKIPLVKIDREKYLRTTFGKHFSDEDMSKIVLFSPIEAGVPSELIKKKAEAAIKYEKRWAATKSLGLGAGGMVGIAPDLAQYYAHVFRVIQKLAYLYGWPEITNVENETDDEFKNIIMGFMGVMLLVKGANTAVIKFSQVFGRHVAKQIGEGVMLKQATATLIKIAEKVGIQITQKVAGELAKKAIPVIGGVVSAGFTWVMFNEEANNLLKFLEENPYGGSSKFSLT